MKALTLSVILLISCFTLKGQIKQADFSAFCSQVHDSLESRKFGIQISLLSDSIDMNYSDGIKNRSEKVNGTTTFNIGSSTKLITGLLVLKAIEENKLSLDDKLKKFLSGNKNVDPNITIRNLLLHTSGLRGMTDAREIYTAFTDSTHRFNQGNLYYIIEQSQFKPDSRHQYCNYNYILLGYILEKVYKEDFYSIFKRELVDRYYLASTKGYTVVNDPALADPMIETISYRDSTHTNYYKNACYSAGSISSTAKDMCKLLFNVFVSKSFLNENSLSILLQSTATKDSGQQYGFGIEKELHKDGITWYGHGGDNLGYSCRLFYNPEKSLVGVALFNTYGEWEFKEFVLEKLIRLAK